MKLHLASIGVAMATVALSSHSTVPAVRGVDASATEPVECDTGEKTFDIKAANETVSFKCAKTSSLDPKFEETTTKAYESTTSSAVPLTDIVPKAKLTRTDTAPAEKVDRTGGTKDYSYQLTVPELPAENKKIVFKCSSGADGSAEPSTQVRQEGTATTTCTVIINVAKSAASIAATPLAAAGSLALAALASVVAQAL